MKQSVFTYHWVVVAIALWASSIGHVFAGELTDVTINGRSLSAQEIQRLEAQLGMRIKPGDYFMDVQMGERESPQQAHIPHHHNAPAAPINPTSKNSIASR